MTKGPEKPPSYDRPDPRRSLMSSIAAAGTWTAPKPTTNASHCGTSSPRVSVL
jgi:hypothetical protein